MKNLVNLFKGVTIFLLLFLFSFYSTKFVSASEEDPLDSQALPEQTETISKQLDEISDKSSDTVVDGGVMTLSLEEEIYSEPQYIDKNFYLESNDVEGAFRYTFQIITPPGRNNFGPELSLLYNSQSGEVNNLYGYGWSDSIPYISRINRTGSNNIYSEKYFYSTLSGELRDSDSTSTLYGLFGAKTENGDFYKYEYHSGDYWAVTDKAGTVYKFGVSTSTQQYNIASTSQVYKWMLEEVRDTNDNFIKYEYYHDEGQIYPSKIFYTGNGEEDGIYEIEFLRETRSDKMKLYSAGFEVKSNYRINEIKVKIDGVWVKKYELDYIIGDNTLRSLLGYITEVGRDESLNEIDLPSNEFNYQNKVSGWDLEPDYALPSSIYLANNNFLLGTKLIEINGDGLVDVIFYHPDDDDNGVYVNQGGTHGWEKDAQWNFPFCLSGPSSSCPYTIRFSDINGDGLDDFINSYSDPQTYEDLSDVYINTGSSWSYDPNWEFPEIFNGQSDDGIRLADANGDGLVDILRGYNDPLGGPNVSKVYLNNGYGWTLDSGFILPIYLNSDAVRLADFNGDGLVDIAYGNDSGEGYYEMYINTGTSWEEDTSWQVPVSFHNSQYIAVVDVNGDGLTDIIDTFDFGDGYVQIYINKGDGGWDVGNNSNFPIQLYNGKNGEAIIDVDGDGLVDLIRSDYGEANEIYIAKPNKADLLSNIFESKKSEINIKYKGSAEYFNDSSNRLNPDLPFSIQTVDQISVGDGLGNWATTTFEYFGGDYYYNSEFDRKFSGFSKIKRENQLGNVTNTYYHQGNISSSTIGEYNDDISKQGRVYRIEVYDDNNNLYKKTINKWESIDLGNNNSFVKKTRYVDFSYDGDADHRDKSGSYLYNDNNGNLVQHTDWGEVSGSDNGTFTDLKTDLASTTYEYAASTTANIYSLSKKLIEDYNGDKVAENIYYYDNLSFGNVEKGNLTKEEMWVSENSYIDIEKSYNSYGLITQEKDPKDMQTNYVYDTHDLYVATSTNALNQSAQYYYDYSSGKSKKTIDYNGNIFETVFDGLDRVKEEKQPGINTPSTQITKSSLSYYDFANPRYVKQIDYLNDSTSTESYTYINGNNKVIQERSEAENGDAFSVKDYIYNPLGYLSKESLHYFSDGASSTIVVDAPELFLEYSYDALNRLTRMVNIVGTTTNEYDQWALTVDDAEGNIKKLFKDSQRNLIQVDEHNDANTYSTYYNYNLLGNLTKIEDALDNVREFNYDGLGRLLNSEDLHDSSDLYYASTSYWYDASSNLTEIIDGKNQIINYSYDNINRLLTEDFTGQAGIEKTYGYDLCTNGIGKLCYATTSDIVTSYNYNVLGLTEDEIRKINGVNYISSFDFDRQGNTSLITYPDNSQIKYIYNKAGQLERVEYNEGSGTFASLIDDYNYGPTGKVELEDLSNGIEKHYIYDANELYRLRNIRTNSQGADFNISSLNKVDSAEQQNFFITFLKDGKISKEEDKYQDISRTSSTSKAVLFEKQKLPFSAGVETRIANKMIKYNGNYVYGEELISGEKYWFETILLEESFNQIGKVGRINENIIRFESDDGKMKIEQEAFEDGLKETIILEDDSRGLSFRYKINTSDNIDISKEYEVIILQGQDGKGTLSGSKFRVDFERPFAIDANGVRYEYEYILNDDYFRIQPKEDMSEVEFPIAIDPTYVVTSYVSGQSIIMPSSGEPCMARTSDGRLHVIYGRRTNSHYQTYNYSDDNGETWGTPYTLDTEGTSGSSNGTLYVDENDNVLVIYKDQYYAKSRKYNGTSWTTEIALGLSPFFRGSGAYDSSGLFHYVANTQYGVNMDLVYLTYNGSSWSSETMIVDSSYRAMNPTVQIDSDDKLHLAYLYRPSSSSADSDVNYKSKESGGSWSSPLNIETAGTVALALSNMVIDGSDNLHLIFRIGYTQNEIGYKKYNGSSWSSLVELTDYSSSNWEVLSPEIGMRSDGYPYIVYSIYNASSERQVGHIGYDSSGWGTTTTIFSDVNEVYTGSVFTVWQESPIISEYNYNAPARGFVALYECDNASGNEELCLYVDPSLIWSEDYMGEAPGSSTDLLVENKVNPTAVMNSTPDFSAIFHDTDVDDKAIYYQLQVASSSINWTELVWDSGKTNMSTTTENFRCNNIEYGGLPLNIDGSQYYWRIKFWDDEDHEGAWNISTSSFEMGTRGLQDYTYTYDAVGNIIEINNESLLNAAKTIKYVYDDLYRLVSASTTNAVAYGDYLRTYQYDAIGNIISKLDVGNYSYYGNQGNSYALPSAATQIGSDSYAYDRNGNLVSDENWTHVWDYKNRLISSTDSGGKVVTYVYDHNGERVKYVASSSEIQIQDWCNENYAYKQKISIDHSKIDSEISNFPLRIFANTSPVFASAQSDGDDIIFYDDSSCVQLDHDLVSFNNNSGSEIMLEYVNIPLVSSNSDTEIYMYYGNPVAVSTEDEQAVWDSNFQMVQTMEDVLDSTSNNNDGSVSGATQGANRNIGEFFDFDGNGDYITWGDNPGINGESELIFEILVELDNNNSDHAFFSRESGGFKPLIWRDEMVWGTTIENTVSYDDGVERLYGDGDEVNDTGLHYYVFAWDATSKKTFIDGLEIVNSPNSTNGTVFPNVTGTNLYTGIRSVGGMDMDGRVYEIRISNSSRSYSYINANKSQLIDGNLVLYSQEESKPIGTSSLKTTYYPNKYYNIDSNGKITKHIFANGQIVATIETDGVNTSTYFTHTDHLGGSSVVTDSDGELVQQLDYFPFGDIRLDEQEGDFDEQRKFTGHEYDDDTDLNYMVARYQNPTVGKFLSIDPATIIPNKELLLKPQELNSYSYVANNPLSYIDPTGEIVELVARGLDRKFGGMGVHTFLRITPDHPKDFGQKKGYSYTLGGYNVGSGKLEKRTDYGIDPDISNNRAKLVSEVQTPGDMTDTVYIKKIQDVYDSYENSEDYGGFSINKNGYNCNNFSTSLIEKSGGSMPEKYNPRGLNPGLGERMPSMRNTDVTLRSSTNNNVNNQTKSKSGWFSKAWSKFKSKINK